MPKIMTALKAWLPTFNLKVHDKKTQMMCIKSERPVYINFPVCESYKYLGVEVSKGKSASTQKLILNSIRSIGSEFKCMKVRCCIKAKRQVIIWWYIAKLLYKHISDIYLGRISVDGFVQQTFIQIKRILNICKGIKQEYVSKLLGINMQKTIYNMLKKLENTDSRMAMPKCVEIDYKMEELGPVAKTWSKIQNSIISNSNALYYLLQAKWWSKHGYSYRCKTCLRDLTLYHIKQYHSQQYPDILTSEIELLLMIGPSYEFLKATETAMIGKSLKEKTIALWIDDGVRIGSNIKRQAIDDLSVKNIFVVKRMKNANMANQHVLYLVEKIQYT
eukprot:TRINITY_DN30709_c0_g1_i1.p1 TRINITY_DN30709_c0_g1~~TRINITY_DN30709_c0_g1_i1.p1  ORF type:complete len:373 (-),score=22.45 TRINITY_DN30709_c0_g1_i1:82-1077(-)